MQLSYSHGVSPRPLIGKNVKIEGRLKDMICRGGEKIFPREVEEFLFSHPKIAEAYVIGVPDSYYGEQVMAWVKCTAFNSRHLRPRRCAYDKPGP